MGKPNILKSRKFWIAIADAVVLLIGLWVGVLLIPERAELVIATLAIIQVPVAVLINSIAQQNVAALNAGIVNQ